MSVTLPVYISVSLSLSTPYIAFSLNRLTLLPLPLGQKPVLKHLDSDNLAEDWVSMGLCPCFY